MWHLLRNIVLAAQVQKHWGIDALQTRRIVGPKRWFSVIGPITMRIEILNAMQGSSKSFNGRALGSCENVHLQRWKREPAVQGADVHFRCNDTRAIINNVISRIDAFFDPASHVTDANLKLLRSFLACDWILGVEVKKLSIQKIRVIAVRFGAFWHWIEHVWGADCSIRSLADIDV